MTQLEPIDGSVYAYQVSPHENLVYVTIAGPDEDKPMIVAFDSKDLDYLKAARKELRAGAKRDPDPGAVLAILEASRADVFVHDRVEYRYNSLAGEWVAWGRVDTTDKGEA
ncbi:hypothetical protein QYF68_09940 [Mycolicibacterium austroafricanum]|uniref:Uncharacterized protein n=1 Tax=Mycolicibacterium austroafricanum TaxID=39687 RepID=A0ABT8HBK7_MYCAO|nr:hypothetical protein [Mycolicibacterium austroafricanum]MDN4518145.1 hypothetical protein [Mycolicibacterium austroafricanum]